MRHKHECYFIYCIQILICLFIFIAEKNNMETKKQLFTSNGCSSPPQLCLWHHSLINCQNLVYKTVDTSFIDCASFVMLPTYYFACSLTSAEQMAEYLTMFLDVLLLLIIIATTTCTYCINYIRLHRPES